jgi:hypothetical protein
MDRFKDMANDAMGSGIEDQLKDINFPASKGHVLSRLEEKGVPSQILDRVRNAEGTHFTTIEDLRSKTGL